MKAMLQEVVATLLEIRGQEFVVITFDEPSEDLFALRFSFEPEGLLLSWPDRSTRLFPGFPEPKESFRFVLQERTTRSSILIGEEGGQPRAVEFLDLPEIEYGGALLEV